MIVVTSNTYTGSIATLTEVFSYAGSNELRLVVVRVELGTSGNPVAGNGTYTISVLINDKTLVPITSFNIPSGTTQAFSVSKELTLDASDTFKVKVLGQAGDTSVAIITKLYDVTPVAETELSGNGVVLVDHNYPTDDNMTLTDGADIPIVGACIYIYTATDYTAGNLGPPYIVAKATTTTGGIWLRPVALNAGSYYAYFFKQGVMSPTAIAFTVT